jgi:hypothetical protein
VYIIRADDKRRGRLNDISHPSLIPYNRVKTEKSEVARTDPGKTSMTT